MRTMLTWFILLNFSMRLSRPVSTLFPYTTLFRSSPARSPTRCLLSGANARNQRRFLLPGFLLVDRPGVRPGISVRSEEHTSELQSRLHLVCRLLLEKKNGTFVQEAGY